jgi:Spy/CpxP family protein refolding chaperone
MEQQNGTPRRRFFKRAAIATLIGGLAAGIGLKTLAHGGPGGGHRGGFMSGPLDPAMVDERLDRMLRHVYAEIDATPEQKALLAPIVKQAAKDLLPLRDKLHDARRQAIALLAADSVDRDAIERLRAGQMALADQASQRITGALADIAAVLTPAQRKDLAERAQRHRRGWHRG